MVSAGTMRKPPPAPTRPDTKPTPVPIASMRISAGGRPLSLFSPRVLSIASPAVSITAARPPSSHASGTNCATWPPAKALGSEPVPKSPPNFH